MIDYQKHRENLVTWNSGIGIAARVSAPLFDDIPELLDKSEKLDTLRSELVDVVRHALDNLGNIEDPDVVYQDLRKMLDLIESSHKKTEIEKQST